MKHFSWLVVLCVFAASNALASPIGAGSIELGGNAAFQHSSFSDDAGSMTQLQMNGGLLFGVNDVLQLGGGLVFIHDAVDPTGLGSFSASSFGAEAMIRFNFGSSGTTVPFVGAGIGIVSWSGDGNEDSSATILPSLGVGLRFLIRDAASFNVGLSYVYQSNALGVEDLNSNTILLGLGFSVFPKGIAID
jgi:hypothetical protein